MISPFREDFIFSKLRTYAKFRENKPSLKFPNLRYSEYVVIFSPSKERSAHQAEAAATEGGKVAVVIHNFVQSFETEASAREIESIIYTQILGHDKDAKEPTTNVHGRGKHRQNL